MWGCWLVLTFVAFSAGHYVNSYYVAALLPAVAAIIALGTSIVVRGPFDVRRLTVVAGGVLATAGYAVYLLHRGSSVPAWLIPARRRFPASSKSARSIPHRGAC